jgi:putative membrane protein
MLMYKTVAARFGLRWLVSSLGLYVAAALLGADRLSLDSDWWTAIIAGLFLALVNMAIKPVLVILSFPAIILTLGLFMLVLNGFLILIASWIYPSLYVKNLGVAIVAGVVIGIVNYLVTRILEDI